MFSVFARMSVRQKILLGFVCVIVLMTAAMLSTLIAMQGAAQANATALEHLRPADDAARDIGFYARAVDDDENYIVLARDKKELETNIATYRDDVRRAADAAHTALALSDTDAQRAALADYDKQWNGAGGYLALNEGAVSAMRAGKVKVAQKLALDTDTAGVEAAIKRFRHECDALMAAAQERAASLTRFAILLGVVLGLCAAVLGVVIAMAIIRSMAATVREINESVESVSVAARQIASGNGDLAQRTEEQASSLEETAASMEELTATVRQNAENSKEANSLAIGASRVAEAGGKVVADVVATMSSIGESARRIEDIISTIDGIAFQTNILALNAAVEAARAGEQGRGFAVVAGEVRNLAQRSASAAKEIKVLINDSVEKTNVGTKLADRAGTTMEEVVTSVRRVTDIMGEISAASVEQGAGIEQVNQAVTQMDQVTQQNAALVEEVSAAASSLEQLAAGVVAAMQVFGIANEPKSAPPAFRKSASARAAAPSRAAAPTLRKPATAARRAAEPKNEIEAVGSGSDNWSSF